MSQKNVAFITTLKELALDLPVAIVAAVIPLLLANAVFLHFASQFSPWRGPRTEFAFQPIDWHSTQFLTWIVLCACAVQTKRVFVPSVIGLAVYALSYGFAWSGPGDLLAAITPLINLREGLILGVLLSSTLMIFTYNKTRKETAPKPKNMGTLKLSR